MAPKPRRRHYQGRDKNAAKNRHKSKLIFTFCTQNHHPVLNFDNVFTRGVFDGLHVLRLPRAPSVLPAAIHRLACDFGHVVGVDGLAAARSRSGSDNHAGCHSLPSRHFVTSATRYCRDRRSPCRSCHKSLRSKLRL